MRQNPPHDSADRATRAKEHRRRTAEGERHALLVEIGRQQTRDDGRCRRHRHSQRHQVSEGQPGHPPRAVRAGTLVRLDGEPDTQAAHNRNPDEGTDQESREPLQAPALDQKRRHERPAREPPIPAHQEESRRHGRRDAVQQMDGAQPLRMDHGDPRAADQHATGQRDDRPRPARDERDERDDRGQDQPELQEHRLAPVPLVVTGQKLHAVRREVQDRDQGHAGGERQAELAANDRQHGRHEPAEEVAAEVNQGQPDQAGQLPSHAGGLPRPPMRIISRRSPTPCPPGTRPRSPR